MLRALRIELSSTEEAGMAAEAKVGALNAIKAVITAGAGS